MELDPDARYSVEGHVLMEYREMKRRGDRLTPRQSAIIGAYTGILVGPIPVLHAYIEDIMDGPVLTHEFATRANEIKEAAKADFMALVAEEES